MICLSPYAIANDVCMTDDAAETIEAVRVFWRERGRVPGGGEVQQAKSARESNGDRVWIPGGLLYRIALQYLYL
jgi:hypothetical protein